MSDADNYTIEDAEEPDVEVFEATDERPPRDSAAIGVLILGLATIAGAAYCSTLNANFQGSGPGKLTFFVTSLTLPLSIAGALLATAGICVLAFRLRVPNGSR